MHNFRVLCQKMEKSLYGGMKAFCIGDCIYELYVNKVITEKKVDEILRSRLVIIERKACRTILCGMILIIIFASFSGCGGYTQKDERMAGNESVNESLMSSYDKYEEGEVKMGTIEMTAQEKQLLCKVYPNEEMIREGKLFGYEQESLKMLRAGTDYISSQYPSCSFTVTSIEPANKFYPWTTLQVVEESYGAARVTVTPEEGMYRFGENFYGKYLREQYDGELEKILADIGIETVAFTDFPNVLEGVGENTTVLDLIEMRSKLNRKTCFYVPDVMGRAELVDQMKGVLSEVGVYGAYTVYFVSGSLSESVETLEKSRADYEHMTFNCFDVQ